MTAEADIGNDLSWMTNALMLVHKYLIGLVNAFGCDDCQKPKIALHIIHKDAEPH